MLQEIFTETGGWRVACDDNNLSSKFLGKGFGC